MHTTADNMVSETERQRWIAEAIRLNVADDINTVTEFAHISCTVCRESRNAVRAAQAAEKTKREYSVQVEALIREKMEQVTSLTQQAWTPFADVMHSIAEPAKDVYTPPPPSLAERFARVVSRAERLGVTVRLVAAPTDEYEALRDPRYRGLGDAADLEGQLDIIDAYVAGYGWTKPQDDR